MTIPSATGLAQLQAVIQETFTATATIKRRTQVSDGAGGFTDTYPTVATSACSFTATQITPVERENAIGIQTISFFQFSFPAGTDVRSADRITVGSRTFEVVAPRHGSLEILRRVLAQEIY